MYTTKIGAILRRALLAATAFGAMPASLAQDSVAPSESAPPTRELKQRVDQTDREPAEDEQLLRELMQVVEQGTELATRTKMNVDYVPGMATVLESELMQSLGARTVLDAMALVPGVLAYRGGSGQPVLLVRGIGFPFNTGNVKVLVDGAAMSGESSGISNSVLLMPLGQVERVEFVRGPGSTLYGDFAFMGLLNIITRREGQAVFLQGESGPAYSGGGHSHWQSADAATRISLNASTLRTDAADLPNDAAGEDRQEFAVLSLQHQGFQLGAQTVRRRLTRPTSDSSQRNDALTARYQGQLLPQLQGELAASWLDTDFADPGTTYRGDSIDGAGELRWTGWSGHTLIARLSTARERTDEALQFRPPPPPPLPPPPNDPVFDVKRNYWGIGLQDQWAAGDALTVTAGLRYDQRRDLDQERLTPRLGIVWRASDAHIFKVQYAEGYRAPTFFELYAPGGRQDNLEVETVGTSELSYIFRGPQQVGRVTLFDSRLRDMIFFNGPGFDNRTHGGSRGVEAEWQQQLVSSLQLQANLSYADSYSTRTSDGSEGADPVAANWLGNLALMYRPAAHWLLATHYTHVGERQTQNPPAGEEHRLAFTVSATDLLTPGLDLRLFVRNALGREEFNVSAAPNGISVSTYDSRIVGLQASYGF